jgi:hypothetical protein
MTKQMTNKIYFDDKSFQLNSLFVYLACSLQFYIEFQFLEYWRFEFMSFIEDLIMIINFKILFIIFRLAELFYEAEA